MNWNIVFLVLVVGIVGFIWYDAKQDALVEQQEAMERQRQRDQEIKAELERQRALLADEHRSRQQEIEKERQRLEDEHALEQMQNQAARSRLQREREERVKQIEREIQSEKAKQEFNNRAWARQAYEECLREADHPDQCPDYNELQERLAD